MHQLAAVVNSKYQHIKQILKDYKGVMYQETSNQMRNKKGISWSKSLQTLFGPIS